MRRISESILGAVGKEALGAAGQDEAAVLVGQGEAARVLGALDGPGGGLAGAVGVSPELEDADLVGVGTVCVDC